MMGRGGGIRGPGDGGGRVQKSEAGFCREDVPPSSPSPPHSDSPCPSLHEMLFVHAPLSTNSES